MEDLIITPHESILSYQSRCQYYQQQGKIVWFTGLSGAGKSTLASELEYRLIASGKVVCLLDGDNIRYGLNSDLNFTEMARKENIRRLAELAVYLARQAFIVLVSAISPHRNMRAFVRDKSKLNCIEFIEVFVDASLKTCQKRDPKGLYQKTAFGELENFSGIDSIYEVPLSPEIHLDTEKYSIKDCIASILKYLGSVSI